MKNQTDVGIEGVKGRIILGEDVLKAAKESEPKIHLQPLL